MVNNKGRDWIRDLDVEVARLHGKVQAGEELTVSELYLVNTLPLFADLLKNATINGRPLNIN